MNHPMTYLLRCVNCGKEYVPDRELYTCPDCLDRMGTLEVVYSLTSKTQWYRSEYPGIWAYADLLPIVKDPLPPSLYVGNTPLVRAPRIEREFGIQELWIKDDGKNPTASFKDRASVVAIAKALEYGYTDLFAASTGNAASSLAGLCAPAGLKAHIYLPETAPEAKIAQLLIYGAQVFAVRGSYDEAFDLSLREGFQKGWYCRNSAINPYLLEGKKTGTFELIRELNMRAPDIILVGVGDGTVYSSIHKAAEELAQLRLIRRIPTIIGIQSEGANAVCRTFYRGEPFTPADIKDAASLADSIAVGKPRDVIKACQWAEKHNGFFLTVSDEEIGKSIVELARASGVFAEPAGAAAYAGLKRLKDEGFLNAKARVALMITGNGLKDARAAVPYLAERVIPVSVEGIREK